jgi:hypothetical protein
MRRATGGRDKDIQKLQLGSSTSSRRWRPASQREQLKLTMRAPSQLVELAFGSTAVSRSTQLAETRKEEPLRLQGVLKVELNGALSNPFTSSKTLLIALIALHQTLLQKAARSPREPRSAPPRPSSVLETIALALALAGRPMRARDIHAAAETLAGQQLRWSSVKASLAGGASGRSPHFDRLSRGVYRLAQHTSPARSTWD